MTLTSTVLRELGEKAEVAGPVMIKAEAALVAALVEVALESRLSRPPFQGCHCKCCDALRHLDKVCEEMGK